jgi:esterase/lipase
LQLKTVLMKLTAALQRNSARVELHAPQLPGDLDRYLAAQEGRVADLVPGTQKKIVWAWAPGVQTELALVYVHGFSASRQETAPLAEVVAEKLKANLHYTRLTGHGRSGAAMQAGSVNAWLNDTYAAYAIGRRLGQKVIMMGVSTGGTALTWLATRPDMEGLGACILISPNFAPADWTANILTWPGGLWLAQRIIGKERCWQAENDLHEHYWTTRYPTAALVPMMRLVKGVRDLDLGRISIPVQVIYAPGDRVVSPRAVVKTFAAIGAHRKALVPFTRSEDPSQHVLAGDILSPGTTVEVATIISDFIRSEVYGDPK